MEAIKLLNIRTAEELIPLITALKSLIEEKVNLKEYSPDLKLVPASNNLMQRLALMAGLHLDYDRSIKSIEEVKLNPSSHFHDTVFTRNNLPNLWSALLKIRYSEIDIDWDNIPLKSKVINYEMINGANYLLAEANLDSWLQNSTTKTKSIHTSGKIPLINLLIGKYEDDIPANLNINGLDIPNTQILISGSTGSGKTNLLSVLLNQIRTSTIETAYPVNFLLFDYKGEFSDPSNRHWLSLFEVDNRCILDPMTQPLPFAPFKDFTNKPQNEINLYATELSSALLALDRASISANMANRLTEAVINSYEITNQTPINFDLIIDEYTKLQADGDKMDSVKSLLSQLIRSNLFTGDTDYNLIQNSLIIKLDSFPKDGAIAKAIVYFTISALNNLYEKLPVQQKSDECVQIRHFTIIDEAHYMLDFDNSPLRSLIAIGRNKGLSLILATQNMDSYKSKYFDFYANAQYPLIMRQQTISDKIIKDLFAVSGSEFQEIKNEISSLKKGEVILRNPTASVLGMGKKYKKILVSHTI